MPANSALATLSASRDVPDVTSVKSSLSGNVTDRASRYVAISGKKSSTNSTKKVERSSLKRRSWSIAVQCSAPTSSVAPGTCRCRHRGVPRIDGASPLLAEALEKFRRAAATDVTVLLTGESGTGKELLARALHVALLATSFAREAARQLRRPEPALSPAALKKPRGYDLSLIHISEPTRPY